MVTVCFSETLATADESTRRQNPKEQHHHPHRRENQNLTKIITLLRYLSPIASPLSTKFSRPIQYLGDRKKCDFPDTFITSVWHVCSNNEDGCLLGCCTV
jgi:hypothetical protein